MDNQKFIYPKSVRQRPSFAEVSGRVREQLEIDCLIDNTGRYPPEADDIVNIVADAYCRNPRGCMRIGGELIDTDTVCGMFCQLRCEHVALVIERLRAVNYPIKNKAAYLRTALYNSLLEINAHYANLYASNGGADG